MGDLAGFCSDYTKSISNLLVAGLSQLFKSGYVNTSDVKAFEDYLKTILNDPELYCEVVYKFFNCHMIFQLIPHVCSFLAVNS